MVKSVSITDTQFRLGVGVGSVALVAALSLVGFCGSIALPEKSAPPVVPVGTSSQLLTRSSATLAAYQDLVAHDATTAGVRAPTLDELSRVLPYREDHVRHVLAAGAAPIELAGLQLRAVRLPEGLGLEIVNLLDSDIGYEVTTAMILPTRPSGSVVAFNAMTIGKGKRETRVESGWRDGAALAVTRVETLEVPALSAWYLGHVPPSAVGIEVRIARGHQAPGTSGPCALPLSQSVRNGLERGEIGWRDLVDFYARHHCQTYQFPISYRAFNADHERSLPAVSAGM